MATNKLSLLVSSLLVLQLALLSTTLATDDQHAPAKPMHQTEEVVVEGMVYCQSCNFSGTGSLMDAKPIASAKVSIVCKNYKNRVTYYKTFQTTDTGYFSAELKGYETSQSLLDHPLHACKVKLVSSPLGSCNLLSNINDGMYGAPLRYENKRLYGGDKYEAVIYAAGPMAFRPSYCPPKEKNA